MVDDRDTGEHFFDVLPDQVKGEVRVSASRIAYLTAQIDFLDREVARYRQIVETERIRYATEITELELAADCRSDDEARRFRAQTKTLHDSYRSRLGAQQIEHDEALSASVAAHHRELEAERKRYEDTAARTLPRLADAYATNRARSTIAITESPGGGKRPDYVIACGGPRTRAARPVGADCHSATRRASVPR